MGASLHALWDRSLVWKEAQPHCIGAGLDSAVRLGAGGKQEQFLLYSIPYVWWLESNLLPEGGGPIAVLSSS